MLYATLDLDLLEDPRFRALEAEHTGGFWLFARLLQFAKRYKGSHGRLLCSDGAPVLPWMLSMTHQGDRSHAEEWARFLDLCVELGVLSYLDEERCYQITDWKRWHKKPSDTPEAVKARVDKHRALLAEGVTPCNALQHPVTLVTPQSRAEHNKAEQSMNKTEQSTSDENFEKAHKLLRQLNAVDGTWKQSVWKSLQQYLSLPGTSHIDNLQAGVIKISERLNNGALKADPLLCAIEEASLLFAKATAPALPGPTVTKAPEDWVNPFLPKEKAS